VQLRNTKFALKKWRIMKKVCIITKILLLTLVGVFVFNSCQNSVEDEFLQNVWNNRPKECSVVFDANGGSGSMQTQKVLSTSLSNTNLDANSFTKDGWLFAGWNTKSDGSGTSFANQNPLSPVFLSTTELSITLYAQWSLIYKVVFDPNGGSGTMTAIETTEIAGKTLTANVFTRSGYVFGGWNTASDGTGSNFADGTALSTVFGSAGAVVTLYAKWVKLYTLSFYPNGGSGSAYSRTVAYNASETVDSCSFGVPVGYYFGTWYTNSDGTGSEYTVGSSFNMPAYDVSLYAYWIEKPAHSITYYNTNSAENTNQTSYREKDSVTISDLTLTNYKFEGWYLNNEGSAISGWSAGTYSENLSLYAKWTYPDTLKAKDGKFGYACGNISLTYTMTLTASAGNYSKTFTYHSGDDTPGASTLTDVPQAAVKDGVTWTVTLVGVNTEYGLKYSGSATSTVSNNKVSLTIPALTRVN